MYAKRFLMLLLVLILTAGLLMGCGFATTPKDYSEGQEIVNELIKESKEESDPEPDSESEPKSDSEPEEESKVDIEAIMRGFWPFENPRLSDFRVLNNISTEYSFDGASNRTDFLFAPEHDKPKAWLLEYYGMPLYGYVPKEQYTVDVTTGQLKNGAQVTDAGLSVYEVPDGFNVIVSFRHEEPHPFLLEYVEKHWPTELGNQELLPDGKLMFKGMSYCFELGKIELFAMWQLGGSDELDAVENWCGSKWADFKGFIKTEDDTIGSVEYKFEIPVDDNEGHEVTGTAYENFDMWEFRFIIPY